MRVLLVSMLIGVSATIACENRLNTLVQEAHGQAATLSTDVHKDCNSVVGTFVAKHTQQYKQILNRALALSMQYMSISAHFGRDTTELPGFKKLFREASDQRFGEAVDMIKYLVKRGASPRGAINVQMPATQTLQPEALPSLGLALAGAKEMYGKRELMHRASLCLAPTATGSPETGCAVDADLSHEMQDANQEEMGRIHKLAAMTNQLAAMFTGGEHSLAEHFFDRQLQ